jgi:hypothetical protein
LTAAMAARWWFDRRRYGSHVLVSIREAIEALSSISSIPRPLICDWLKRRRKGGGWPWEGGGDNAVAGTKGENVVRWCWTTNDEMSRSRTSYRARQRCWQHERV